MPSTGRPRSNSPLGRARRAFARDAVGPAGQDHRLGGEFGQKGRRHPLIGMDFAIDVQLAQAARDQLRHLGAEVDDEKALMLGHASRHRAAPGPVQEPRAAPATRSAGLTGPACRFRNATAAIPATPGPRRGLSSTRHQTEWRSWTILAKRARAKPGQGGARAAAAVRPGGPSAPRSASRPRATSSATSPISRSSTTRRWKSSRPMPRPCCTRSASTSSRTPMRWTSGAPPGPMFRASGCACRAGWRANCARPPRPPSPSMPATPTATW